MTNFVPVLVPVPVPRDYGNQTFFCTLNYGVAGQLKEEPIVVRKSDGIPVVLSFEQEYGLLHALKGAGFPSGRVYGDSVEIARRVWHVLHDGSDTGAHGE
jgi:hypothetical protein